MRLSASHYSELIEGLSFPAVLISQMEGVSKINSRYRLLVVDIDGTLLDKNGIICAEDKEALTRVSNSGIRVSLSTGRVVQACWDDLP